MKFTNPVIERVVLVSETIMDSNLGTEIISGSSDF